MPHTKNGKAFTDLVLETFRFHGRLLAAGDSLTKPLGLTSARWQVLGAIEGQSQSVAQIGRQMGLARQNVQRLANLLEEEGLVEYAPNPDHRRAKLVCLTQRGKKAVKELARRQAVWANQTSSRVNLAEIEVALKALRALRASLG
ncbi:MAG: MarR family transcriptional regulator [Bryobacteraceae bacterium]|nr:MarR family transcriptional regulator [Bryobacteraceae bacterium]